MATRAAAQPGDPVVLINVFEVPAGEEEQFVAGWKEARDHLSKQDGFISTKLHESLNPEALYRFINVAQWQSPQKFQAAVGSDAFRQITQRTMGNAKGRPSLYRVVAE